MSLALYLFVLPTPWKQPLDNLANSTEDPIGDTQAPEKVLGARDPWGGNELGPNVLKKGRYSWVQESPGGQSPRRSCLERKDPALPSASQSVRLWRGGQASGYFALLSLPAAFIKFLLHTKHPAKPCRHDRGEDRQNICLRGMHSLG